MKPTLDRHEIMIVHNSVHNALFAHVPQNKVALSARRWNPMNQNVLCLPEVIGTMRNKDREEDAMVSYICKKWVIDNQQFDQRYTYP